MTLAEAMHELEKAGSARTRKTYTRHGVCEPMFGVSFATLKALMKRINVDHELALALWNHKQTRPKSGHLVRMRPFPLPHF